MVCAVIKGGSVIGKQLGAVLTLPGLICLEAVLAVGRFDW